MTVLTVKNKKYIPIERTISAFSCFPNTHEALYISQNDLYYLNLKTGTSTKLVVPGSIKFFKVICLESNKCVLLAACPAIVYNATIINNKIVLDTQTSISLTYPTLLSATSNGSVIVASDDTVVGVTRAGVCYYSQGRKNRHFSAIAISNDESLLATATEDRITVLETQNFRVLKKIQTTFIPLCVEFSLDNKHLLYGDDCANIISVEMATNKKTVYNNVYNSKPISLRCINNTTKFVCSFLSSSVATYTVGYPEAQTINLNDFSSRYFQYADLVNSDTLAVCVEDLRNETYKIDTVPTSDTIVVLKLIE